MAGNTMKLSAVVVMLALAASLAGCAPTKPNDSWDCSGISTIFEMSNQPLAPDAKTKAGAALSTALSTLGFKLSEQRPGRYDNLTQTDGVRYIVVSDRSNGHGFMVLAYGQCDDRYSNGQRSKTREAFLDSITEKLIEALQPYATEKVRAMGMVQNDGQTIFTQEK